MSVELNGCVEIQPEMNGFSRQPSHDMDIADAMTKCHGGYDQDEPSFITYLYP